MRFKTFFLFAMTLFPFSSEAATYVASLFPNALIFRGGAEIFTFMSIPEPASAASLAITATGDINEANEFTLLSSEGMDLGSMFDGVSGLTETHVLMIDFVTISKLGYDGSISFLVEIPTYSGTGSLTVNSLTLEYATATSAPEAIFLLLLGFIPFIVRGQFSAIKHCLNVA